MVPHITQEDLIPYIIESLRKFGCRASKTQVEKDIYELFESKFQEPWYQDSVAGGIPRWKHNIAWAKEKAKKAGLVKRPDDSGWGIWELTEKGKKYRLTKCHYFQSLKNGY